jgi:queuine tRNA-ribosyltransferase
VYDHAGKRMSLRNAEHTRSFVPIDSACECMTCRTYTRAYLHHLFISHEMLGGVLASVHNLHFLVTLVKRERERILSGAV